MGVKITAVQAALLVGRNERRIRDWIATQRLPAIKVGQTWQIDTEDLQRIPGVTIDHEQLALLQAQDGQSMQGLLGRIAQLEHTVQCLHSEMAVLYAQLGTKEPQVANDNNSVLLLSSVETGKKLPIGSMRVKKFALIHKVHAAILNYQIETDKIEETSLVMPNGRRAHWLTPDQQKKVIDFWQQNRTHYVPCPRCPHHFPGEQQQDRSYEGPISLKEK